MMRRLTKSKKGQTMQRQPHALLDTVMMIFGLHNDHQLADKLSLSAGSVSRIRNGTQNVSPALLLTIYERSGLAIDNIKELIQIEQERRTTRQKDPHAQ